MPFDLTGRVALVTGSSRGIGLAIARTLAAARATVVVHGKSASEELEAARVEMATSSPTAISVTGDLVGSATAHGIVEDVASALGRLDILVNNAGHVVPCSADEMTEELWDSVIDVNLRAAFFCAQAASMHMRKDGFGRIINISSQGGEVAIPTYVHYGVSKAGLKVMTRYLAVEWAATASQSMRWRPHLCAPISPPRYFGSFPTSTRISSRAFPNDGCASPRRSQRQSSTSPLPRRISQPARSFTSTVDTSRCEPGCR